MNLNTATTRRRLKFTPPEDSALIELVQHYGVSSWPRIAAEMPGRNVRQCRDRWNHYLIRDALVDQLPTHRNCAVAAVENSSVPRLRDPRKCTEPAIQPQRKTGAQVYDNSRTEDLKTETGLWEKLDIFSHPAQDSWDFDPFY